MNNFKNIAFSAIIFLISSVSIGSSIECFNCHSETDPGCSSDTPDLKFLMNCSTLRKGPEFVACRKIDNNVDFKVLGQTPTKRVIRQCAANVDRERPCYYRAGFGGRANVCDCFESRCNFAPTLSKTPILTIILLAIASLIFL